MQPTIAVARPPRQKSPNTAKRALMKKIALLHTKRALLHRKRALLQRKRALGQTSLALVAAQCVRHIRTATHVTDEGIHLLIELS